LQQIKIVVADAQFVTRTGIKTVLSQIPEFLITAEVKNSAELLKELKIKQPHVVIIDYNIPGYFQIDDLKKIKMFSPETFVMVVSSDHNKNNIYKVLDLGIKNFITKECDSEEIIQAVHATAKGQKFFCAKVVDIILEKHFNVQNQHCEPSQLSQRETEIVQLIAEGLTGREIAGKLFLSHHTVSTHRKNILKKLHVNSTSELVLYAIRFGIVSSVKIKGNK
jgi:DNA-binding NarL/FixJ family response regulator